MLVRKKCYTLQSDADLDVNITVHPCCTIEIDIPKQRQYLRPRLDQLHFKLTDQGMILVVDSNAEEDEPYQELCLSRKDAMQLCRMINEVVEDHEDLMSALC